MTILTPELASAMLDVSERRARHSRKTVYASTTLEAAMGAPDFAPTAPPHVQWQRSRYEEGLAKRRQAARRRDTEWLDR